MKLNNKLITTTLLASSMAIMFSGCSLKNPFGIGYDTSVCEASKDFGVCGAPKDIYKYRDDIRKVQADYLNAGLDTVLFFGISKEGYVMVKDDRDGQWERYDISGWKKIIDEANKEKQAVIDEQNALSMKMNNQEREARPVSYLNDIPVTEENDLSVKYQDQGPLITTRTQIGDIIRDNGLIQQAFVANYVDYSGDLISSHEVYVVVKDSEWVVGEKTPKSSRIEDMPTPISTELLERQSRTNAYQERVVDKYNIDDRGGVMDAVINDPENLSKEKKKDMDLINSFINEK
jgi:hypothetical protein